MRVIIDIRPVLERRRGGVATYASEIVRALASRARNEYVLFSNARGLPVPADMPAASASITHRFSRYPNRALNAAMAFARHPRLERLAGEADLAYLPNLNFVRTELPLVVTVHDLSFVRFPGFFSRKQRLWHSLVDPKRLLTGAAAVVAVSAHTKQDLLETFSLPEDRVHVVPPAASSAYSPAAGDDAARVRRTYGLPERFFLYLGALEPRKNVEGLIAAFDRSKSDADLVIAGGKGWLYRDIFSRAAAARRRDRITFLGYVDERDKPGLYAAATALVYPSFYEGFGMPPLEAMSVGTPVIASHTSSLGEVVGDAGLLVDPHSVEELAAAMDAIVDDAGLSARLRAKGLDRAKKYSWNDSAARLERVFASALGR